jgi:hypothetical protein
VIRIRGKHNKKVSFDILNGPMGACLAVTSKKAVPIDHRAIFKNKKIIR